MRSGSSSTPAEKTAERLGAATRSLIARISIGVGSLIVLVLIAIAVTVWFKKVYADPKHVFWGTVANSLSTQGVTKETLDKTGSGSCQELTQLILAPQPVIRDIKKYTTAGSAGPVRVSVETLSTTHGDYTHYLSIDRTAKNGKKLDYSSIYGQWVKNSGATRCNGSAIFGNAIFGAILFGDLRPADRQRALKLLHDSYAVNFSKVTHEDDANGRRMYRYDATLKLRNFAKAARFYAQSLGLPNSNQINPASYSATSKLPVSITVDVLAHEVEKISYRATNIQEKYSGYGIRNTVSLPTKTISLEQLQNNLNSVR